MTPRQIVTVALRLIAIWLGIEVLRTVPSFFVVGTSSQSFTYTLFTLALTAIISLTLWFFPYTIAGRVLPSEGAPPQVSVAPDMWLAMGCSLIGLWILTTTLPHLAVDIYVLNYMSVSDSNSTMQRWIIYYLGEIAVGIWLMLGAKGFRKFFWWARDAGINKAL